jgi:hypothetical protein
MRRFQLPKKKSSDADWSKRHWPRCRVTSDSAYGKLVFSSRSSPCHLMHRAIDVVGIDLFSSNSCVLRVSWIPKSVYHGALKSNPSTSETPQ